MKKSFLSNVTFTRLSKWWLTFILLFLPFQHTLIKINRKLWSDELSTLLNRLDEITIVIFLPMAVREFIKNEKKPDKIYFILLVPILALSIHGIVSGMVNGNYIIATVHGTFTYVKYFFVIYIYAAFFREFSDFKRVFRLILIVAVFLGAVAFIQEAWAMGNRYILQKNIYDIFYIEIFRIFDTPVKPDYFIEWDKWRIGILRTASLMINSNFLGIYMLLILVIYIQIVEKGNFAVFIFLLSGIFGSVSRVVYTSFILIAGIQIFRGKKWWIVSFIPITILLFYLSPLPEYINSNYKSNKPLTLNKENYYEGDKKGWDNYRSQSREIAFEIWKDHILFGVGPGMYGGGISIKYKSPVYEKYGFDPMRKPALEKWHTIDQFWTQVLAELGIIGILCFAWFFISLATILFILKNKASSNEKKGLFAGLATYIIVILIYAIAYDFNVPPVTFTYFALVGIGLSCGRRIENDNGS